MLVVSYANKIIEFFFEIVLLKQKKLLNELQKITRLFIKLHISISVGEYLRNFAFLGRLGYLFGGSGYKLTFSLLKEQNQFKVHFIQFTNIYQICLKIGKTET